MLGRDGTTCSIPNAMMVGFREPTDDEWDAAIAELEKVIGAPEAARQSWRRRLCVLPGGAWGLTVNECGFLSGNDYGLLQFTKGATDAFPVALPLAEGVALVKSTKDNPELELARRRTFVADLNRRHAQQDEDARSQSIAAARRQQDAETRAKEFRHEAWVQLQPWCQALFALALRVKERDPELADDLRKVASSSTGFHGERSTPLLAPSAVWW